MPRCNKCHNDFPNRVYVDGKNRNLQNRKFCLDCSPFGTHNTRNILISDKEKEANVALRKKKQTEYTSRRRAEVIQKAIEYKGGKCSICGYDRCRWALEFHHINPEDKEFGISDGNTRSWDKVKVELDKCILLCANCHREVESGFTQI
ncbi:putative HNH endonuclease 2 [Bacillus phage BCU4]|uniref:Putative HNH endonuclease 2 n=1 Tax=Bacillus phage BCU4 TaxID=1126951 RepID=J9PQQ3_9CAUD|nr:putative HNH endonuclease 2 [Bacillus phage BCU4]AEW47723.1 putative HNH endonuclease 2 [Bacillus phage BCU4]